MHPLHQFRAPKQTEWKSIRGVLKLRRWSHSVVYGSRSRFSRSFGRDYDKKYSAAKGVIKLMAIPTGNKCLRSKALHPVHTLNPAVRFRYWRNPYPHRVMEITLFNCGYQSPKIESLSFETFGVQFHSDIRKMYTVKNNLYPICDLWTFLLGYCFSTSEGVENSWRKRITACISKS